ncbi:uncharacterized protein [Spinacia oleracea]|uniref:Uncharacterized protein isoform X2 n=1 Tax=Spinacia oleracea TaxID=3562 RepID=A0ABM3QJC7_SPIOL|nr:uncharacterized protein LOC130459868 isoform X2 [Spinacia oleracea]
MKARNLRGEDRGSIAFFTTYRPPVALDIYSCPLSPTTNPPEELHLTDGVSYNSNAREIPPEALKPILKRIHDKHPNLHFNGDDVDSGCVTGMVFISERTNDLETIHIAIRSSDSGILKVFNFAQLFGTFDGVRMEDSGCFAGNRSQYLVYVTTKDALHHRRQPWTSLYRTCLNTAQTQRLTPFWKKIAVASFEKKGGWYGEIENLKTDIFVMDVEEPFNRTLVIEDGGWPTWGSDNVIYFHRKVGDYWGVFRADISNGLTSNTFRVTPDEIDAVTPAAIDDNRVAVATIRKKSELHKFTHVREQEQYRQIEVFVFNGNYITRCIQITANIRQMVDRFNPFIIKGHHGETRIGYHCCKGILESGEDVPRKFDGLQSLHQDIGLFRVSGVFPTFSPDGSKLAFVDNNLKDVWIADAKGLRVVHEVHLIKKLVVHEFCSIMQMDDNTVFSPVWNQNPDKDILYVCFGPPFEPQQPVNICAILNPSTGRHQRKVLTRKSFKLVSGNKIHSNNAFPSTNPQGTELVFRSTRDHVESGGRYKNLYIMENANKGEFEGGEMRRLTEGKWIDTQCKWSPKNDWIVFSSNRDNPEGDRKDDKNVNFGYFSVYLVKANDPDVLVRVISSANDLSGHVNHPFFSPDGRSIVVTSDLAAVSADPMSMPLFLHSARPYGDIFTIDIDPDDIEKNKDLNKFNRITHSRYENATGTWTKFSTANPSNTLNQFIRLPLKNQIVSRNKD